MKVTKLVALKNNFFRVEFDNGAHLRVHEEGLIKHMLYNSKELTDEEFEQIKSTLDFDRAYIKAIHYISFKLRSEYEIYTYLSEDFTDEVIAHAIERLINENYINDNIYAEALKNTMLNTTDKGPLLLKRELEKKRVSKTIIDDAVEAFKESIEPERLIKIRDKELKRYKGSKNLFKQKLSERLMTKGYTGEFLSMIPSEVELDDAEFFEKDFEKYYNKHARKYRGFDLKNRVIRSLLGRGYSYSQIDERIGSIEDDFIWSDDES
ncbi:regulatory protein RecX [Phocicoccus schoeneichii]|uniref:Regulatory protein RecX n=1 Tax=Phocicoccus schoeneichii TaxID=1812261 RepID=A0A6V7RQW6_9BACL|nr:RecX family transcriptional regulator [Jeotgalicoccus schoeneichii]GGH54843.1 regulatory protein RecX [Jeotgalicoccus schoeneichii]CAD2080098.1 Regulatory protein RecX [Jeotgalicoccus schoeneichii]